MRGHDQFDPFYKSARSRLLLQTYALTGDLPASRSAVRDAFVAAWHHWPKVSRLDDPAGWLRTYAWQHAQRRHTARIWHRDRTLDDDSRATLEALGKLTLTQRKALLLTQLAGLTLAETAREVALTDEAAGSTLQTAASRFAVQRGVASSGVRPHLEALETRVSEARLPRASIVRRSGTARRRAHTGAGAVAAVVALLLAGMLVHEPDRPAAGLGTASGAGADATPPREAGLEMRHLLDRTAVSRMAPGRGRARVVTDDNTEGDGINTLCQRDRFADPEGVAALVRRFDLRGRPQAGAVQSLELSQSERAARAAYRRVLSWFGDCQDPRVQLLASHRLTGVGDAAMLLELRSWEDPVTTYTLGIARTGALVTSTVREVRTAEAAPLKPMVRLTGESVSRVCGLPESGPCTSRPRTSPSAPPVAEETPGMLQVVDLPPIDGIVRPWIGTDPVRPKVNSAATRCDKADFRGQQVRRARTRSFVAPEARVAPTFGLTQTVGRFRSPTAAAEFVSTLRGRMADCEDRDLATTVEQRHDHSQGGQEMAIWRVTTEISDEEEVTFDMALARRGDLVTQVGFVPAPGRFMGEEAFRALADRSLERLPRLPGRRG